MTINTKGADPMWTAKRHKWFPSLCSLPTGKLIAADIAAARGYTIAEGPAPDAPKPAPPVKPVAAPPRPAPPKPIAPEPPKAPPRPLPAPVAAVPSQPVAPPIPAAVVADRARATALIAMTAKGAEAEAECREAIRAGTSPETYRATVAARSILDAMGASRGT